MNQSTIQTRRPKRIIQVYHNHLRYTKDRKSFADRKDALAWKAQIHSYAPYLKEGRLVIPQTVNHPDLEKCDTILLHDFNVDSEAEAIQMMKEKYPRDLLTYERRADGQQRPVLRQMQCMQLTGSQISTDIFWLREGDDGIEIHLQYDLFSIGEPRRDNFKLANLEEDVPIEVKINGKLDHAMASGRERTYHEQDYIFHLLGQTNEFELARDPFGGSQKNIPKPAKVVDLLKRLF
jgi:hypothetical protein